MFSSLDSGLFILIILFPQLFIFIFFGSINFFDKFGFMNIGFPVV